MDDYISREEVITLLCNVFCACDPKECPFKIPHDGAERCTTINAILDIPAADVEPKWIPVSDTLPDPYDAALISILTKNGYGLPTTIETIGWYDKGKWIDVYGKQIGPEERVTHWMPMPEPPEEGGGEDG